MHIPPDTALVLARPGATVGRLLRGPGALPDARPFTCALGRSGIIAAQAKQEGDGATPAARLALRRILYRADRLARPLAAMPCEPLAPDDGWCDDRSAPAYNRPIRLPSEHGHEALWREDSLYDVIGVLGWNDDPVVPGHGSAIFLHLARPDMGPTEGCVALALPDLLAVLPGLRWLDIRAE